jgi:hypothetical protein
LAHSVFQHHASDVTSDADRHSQPSPPSLTGGVGVGAAVQASSKAQ